MTSRRIFIVMISAGLAVMMGIAHFAILHYQQVTSPVWIVTHEEEATLINQDLPDAKLRDILQDLKQYDPSFLSSDAAEARLGDFIKWDNPSSVRTMLDNGVSTNALNSPSVGSDSLLVADAYSLSPKMFETLAKHGVFERLSQKDMQTIFDGALYNGNVSEVRYLLARGALSSPHAWPPLVENEMTEPDQWYMQKHDSQTDVTIEQCMDGAQGRRVGANRSAITQALIAAGANPNQVDFNGMTALPFAIVAGDTSSVRQLIAHGAKLDLANPKVRLAITYARKYHFTDIIRTLRHNNLIAGTV